MEDCQRHDWVCVLLQLNTAGRLWKEYVLQSICPISLLTITPGGGRFHGMKEKSTVGFTPFWQTLHSFLSVELFYDSRLQWRPVTEPALIASDSTFNLTPTLKVSSARLCSYSSTGVNFNDITHLAWNVAHTLGFLFFIHVLWPFLCGRKLKGVSDWATVTRYRSQC